MLDNYEIIIYWFYQFRLLFSFIFIDFIRKTKSKVLTFYLILLVYIYVIAIFVFICHTNKWNQCYYLFWTESNTYILFVLKNCSKFKTWSAHLRLFYNRNIIFFISLFFIVNLKWFVSYISKDKGFQFWFLFHEYFEFWIVFS